MSVSVGSSMVNGNECAREEGRIDNLFRRAVRWNTGLVFRGRYDWA